MRDPAAVRLQTTNSVAPLNHALTGARALTKGMDDDHKARKAVVRGAELIATGTAVWGAGRQIHAWWDAQRSYYVTVREDDAIFMDLQEWLVRAVPEDDQRSIIATPLMWGRAASHYDLEDIADVDVEHISEDGRPKIGRAFDDNRDRNIFLDGHKIVVTLHKGEKVSEGGYISSDGQRSIVFTAKSKPAQEAVLRKLETFMLVRKTTKRKPNLFLMDSIGHWKNCNNLPPRSLESVVLREGQLDRLVNDMQMFLDSESEYTRRSIPYHRGYLLEGPPGTGKTSIGRALADHFSADVWYAPLGDLSKDTSLLNLMSQVSPKSIILLEDIDIYAANIDRAGQSGSATLSGLLNAMDGISTPHGVIFILTTNKPDVLDSALIRPGRIDLVETIGMPNDEQATRLFEYFYQTSPKYKIPALDRSPAALVEIMKQHMFDPNLAEKALNA